MSIFTNQGLVDIVLDTGIDLSSASAVYIVYKKPDNTTGQWTATKSGKKISYSCSNSDLNQAGKWTIQAKVSIGGRDGYGTINSFKVDEAIS